MEHPTPEQILAHAKGESQDLLFQDHVTQCGFCRTEVDYATVQSTGGSAKEEYILSGIRSMRAERERRAAHLADEIKGY